MLAGLKKTTPLEIGVGGEGREEWQQGDWEGTGSNDRQKGSVAGSVKSEVHGGRLEGKNFTWPQRQLSVFTAPLVLTFH